MPAMPNPVDLALAPGDARLLTSGEKKLAQSIFGGHLMLDGIEVRRKKFFPFQPSKTVMAPRGHLHFHPHSPHYRDDFSLASLFDQGLLIHELVHVWQHQNGINLLLKRRPFTKYEYSIRPGWPLARYNLEQQAEIVRHTFLLKRGATVPGAPPLEIYQQLLPFG